MKVEVPPSASPPNYQRAGMLIIGFVFFVICLVVAAILAFTFGIERPAEARAGTQTAAAIAHVETEKAEQALATQQADALILTPPSDWTWHFEDNFDANINHWPEGTDEDSFGSVARDIRDNKYLWTIDSPEGSFWWAFGPSVHLTLQNYVISVEIDMVEGDSTVIYSGLILNADRTWEGNYYAFGIIHDGSWFFSRYDKIDDDWTELDSSQSKAIQLKGTNQLIAHVMNGHFTLFINGEKVGYVEDSTIPRGSVALFLGSTGSKKPATVIFDNFEIHSERPEQ